MNFLRKSNMAYYPAHCDNICEGCNMNRSGWCIVFDKATTFAAAGVLQAYKDEAKIEARSVGSVEWTSTKMEPLWDLADYDYRVKEEPPKPLYRPFESADEVMAAIKEHGAWLKASDGTYTSIVNVLEDMLYLKENYTFEDGTPFGKLVE